MCRIATIDAFLQQWPDAEFGPGHIVLSDANLEDENIDWCIGLIEAVFDRSKAKAEDMELLESLDWYARCEREELVATAAFLRELRATPENARVGPSDKLCEVVG